MKEPASNIICLPINFDLEQISRIINLINKQNKMKPLNKAIRQIDLFGVELCLNFKQKDKYRSACGGITSFILVIFLGYIFIISFIRVIEKQDYTIKIQNVQSRDPNYSIMNSDNFMIAVKIQDPFSSYFPDSNKTAYNITIEQVVVQTLQNGSKIKSPLQFYELETCTEEHFKSVNFEDQKQIKNQLSSFLCLPLDYELYLQGTYNSELFYYPKLSVKICKSANCYTEEERKLVLQDTSLQVSLSTLIQSNIFLSNKTEDYLYSYINSDFYLQTDFQTQNNADIFFKYDKIIVDNNLFSTLSDVEEINFWSFQLLEYREFQATVTEPDILYEIIFRLSLEQEITTKTVIKFDQFISYLGGILKFFTAIFGLIAIQYNLLAMRLSLANSLYQFNIPKKNSQRRFEFSYDKLINYIQKQINRVDELFSKLKTHAHQVVKISNITKAWSHNQSASFKASFKQQQQQIVSDDKLSEHDINSYTQHLLEYKENFMQKLIEKILETRKQLKLGINFFIYVFLCCSCFKKIWMTRQLIVQCNRMVEKDLDIVNILSKIQQIEKLKEVLLDQDQIQVFDYIPKPIVHVDRKYQITTEDCNEPNQLITKENQKRQVRLINKRIKHDKLKKFLRIYDSYLKLKENNSFVNYRLVKMLGVTMEMIFWKYHEIQIQSQKKEHQETAVIYQPELFTTQKSGDYQSKLVNQVPAKTLPNEDEIEFQNIQ